MKRIMTIAAVIAIVAISSAAHAGETRKRISVGKVKAVIKKVIKRRFSVRTPTGGGAVRG